MLLGLLHSLNESTQREEHFALRSEQGLRAFFTTYLRQIDLPLAIRAIAGMLVGLLVLQLLGDEKIAARWQDLPEVLTTLLFDGLKPDEKTSYGQEEGSEDDYA